MLLPRDVAKLNAALKRMGVPHIACNMNIVLRANLWVDHMVPCVRRLGSISAFAAFQARGGGDRHQRLKGLVGVGIGAGSMVGLKLHLVEL